MAEERKHRMDFILDTQLTIRVIATAEIARGDKHFGGIGIENMRVCCVNDEGNSVDISDCIGKRALAQCENRMRAVLSDGEIVHLEVPVE